MLFELDEASNLDKFLRGGKKEEEEEKREGGGVFLAGCLVKGSWVLHGF